MVDITVSKGCGGSPSCLSLLASLLRTRSGEDCSVLSGYLVSFEVLPPFSVLGVTLLWTPLSLLVFIYLAALGLCHRMWAACGL